jgi:hypothetical protein
MGWDVLGCARMRSEELGRGGNDWGEVEMTGMRSEEGELVKWAEGGSGGTWGLGPCGRMELGRKDEKEREQRHQRASIGLRGGVGRMAQEGIEGRRERWRPGESQVPECE